MAAGNDLDGKVWLVTGASSGFGRAICVRVLARGGRVVAAARKPEMLAGIVATAPNRAVAMRLDVTSQDEIAATLANARSKFGQIDVLVNNAGYGLMSAVEEASDAEVRAQFDVNFFGLAAIVRAVLPEMRARRSGFIVNMSTVGGAGCLGGVAYYCASKWAVEALSESLSREVLPFNIGVLIVEPGRFRTDFFGAACPPANPIEAYEAVTSFRETEAQDRSQPGDPIRAANAIIDTVLQPSPPMRLILGRRAYGVAFDRINARLADMERSKDIAPTADFPGT